MCPPGTDQTCRSPQRWSLLAPLLEEIVDSDPSGEHQSSRWSDSPFLTTKLYDSIFRRLARPAVISTNPVDPVASTLDSLAPIEELPAEIIAIILADPGLEKRDVLALGAGSNTLWTHVRRHIQADFRKCGTARWADTPLVFTGTYLTTFPPALPGICPKMKEYQAAWTKAGTGLGRRGMCPARRWNWDAVSSFQEVGDKNSFEEWRKAVSMISNTSESNTGRLVECLGKLRHEYAEVATGSWFLRNLTLKRFVRVDVSQDEHGEVVTTVTGTPWLTLDTALLMEIRWSSQTVKLDYSRPTPNLSYSIKHVKEEGRWAGHRFDIVREKPSGNGWRDATGSIVKAAKRNAAEAGA